MTWLGPSLAARYVRVFWSSAIMRPLPDTRKRATHALTASSRASTMSCSAVRPSLRKLPANMSGSMFAIPRSLILAGSPVRSQSQQHTDDLRVRLDRLHLIAGPTLRAPEQGVQRARHAATNADRG